MTDSAAASRADHANIVQIFDIGETGDGLCYVVMERLRGQRLMDVIAQGPLPPTRAADLCAQVASALDAAHRAAVVHRDLKPENIFVVPREDQPDFVKVLDFGIAKLWDAPSLTATNVIMGTPPYMAPEQWRTEPDIDGRSDIYALGAILFECLHGAPPLSGNNQFAYLQAHLNQPPPDLHALHPELPAAVCALVQRMLAKERDARPATMREVADTLRTLAPPRSGSYPPVVRTSPRSRSTGGSVGTNPGFIATWRPGGVSLFFGVSVLIALAGGTYLLLRAPALTATLPAQGSAAAGPAAPTTPASSAPAQKPWTPLPTGMVALGPGRLSLEQPAHAVEIRRFALQRTEVSVADFLAYARSAKLPGPLPWDGLDLARLGDRPVNQVDRAQAARYCAALTPGGRLPTEAEWEFAARDGKSGQRFPFVGALDAQHANVDSPTLELQPVTALPLGASSAGVLNLLGNVAEWVSDDASPGRGKAAPLGIVRGGGADTPARGLDAGARRLVAVQKKDPFIGLRCAADLPPKEHEP